MPSTAYQPRKLQPVFGAVGAAGIWLSVPPLGTVYVVLYTSHTNFTVRSAVLAFTVTVPGTKVTGTSDFAAFEKP